MIDKQEAAILEQERDHASDRKGFAELGCDECQRLLAEARAVSPMKLDLGRRRVHVYTSDTEPGRVHVVVVRRHGSFCTCDGFRFHGRCWHVDNARGRTRPLDRKGE